MQEEAFFAEILENPTDPHVWETLGVMADWLEECGDSRGELLRLTRALLLPGNEQRRQREERMRGLLAQGVRPCWPTRINSLGMKLALIPAGTFLMGSPADEEGRFQNEGPQHEVTLSRPFCLGIYPVTQEQYERVMGINPSYFSARSGGKSQVKNLDTRNFPVEYVSWAEAVAFCQRLSQMPEEKDSGRVYRLPTEAEWEYACRGGAISSSPFHFGWSLSSTQANFNGEQPYGGAVKGPYLKRPTAVGSYPPNAFGLYDMHGNVSEWCADWYGAYGAERQVDPVGAPEGQLRVFRGGGWSRGARFCRAAFRSARRGRCKVADRYASLGFRVVLNFPFGGK